MTSRTNILTWNSFACWRLCARNRQLKQQIHELLAIAAQEEHLTCNRSHGNTFFIRRDPFKEDLQPELISLSEYSKLLQQSTRLSRTPQNGLQLLPFLELADLYFGLLEMIRMFLRELLQGPFVCLTGQKGQYSQQMDSVISKMLGGFVQVLKMPPLSFQKFQEAHKTFGKLLKQSIVVLKGQKKILRFFKGRLTAVGIQLARLARNTRLLEELCNLPEEDIEETSTQLLARQVVRRMKNKQMAALIRLYVEDRRRLLVERCHSCEAKIPANCMYKHMKACREYFECKRIIEKIDWELNGKHSDLRSMATEAKKLENDKKKERKQVYDPTKSLSHDLARAFRDDESDSGQSESQSEDSIHKKIPQKKQLKNCGSVELITYQNTVSYLIDVIGKILKHREGNNLRNELKQINSVILPRYKELNVNNRELEVVFDMLMVRMDVMQRMRKAEKESSLAPQPLDSLDMETVNSNSAKQNKRWYNMPEEGYFSGEDASTPTFNSNSNEVRFKDFKVIGLIGKGKYGQVYLVRKKKTGMKYAMKRVTLENAKNYSEVDIFEVINSPYLVKAAFSFSEGGYHYFVMEYMPNGNFSQLVVDRLLEYEAKQYLAEIVMAIDHLHQHGIVHRDIKPENIVIDAKGHLKLTDYGLSEAGLIKKRQKEEEEKSLSKFVLQEIKKKQLRQNKETVGKRGGSPYYMSPEVLMGEKVTKMSDWWSFGVLVYLALTGDLPFKGNITEDLEEITQAVLKLKLWPNDMKFGKEGCLSYEAKDLIEGLLKLDPNRRLGTNIDDIKDHNFFDGIDWNNLLDARPVFAPEEETSTADQHSSDEDVCDDRISNRSTNLTIRRDILDSLTQHRYEKSEAPYKRLLTLANRIESS